jgi:hypothetical protein
MRLFFINFNFIFASPFTSPFPLFLLFSCSPVLLLSCSPALLFSTLPMPAPTNTLLIEGSFAELADEFAHYIDALRKNEGPSLQSDIAPLLEPLRQQEQNEQDPDLKQRDEVLKKLVGAAAVLNSAPEKGELERNKKARKDDEKKNRKLIR